MDPGESEAIETQVTIKHGRQRKLEDMLTLKRLTSYRRIYIAHIHYSREMSPSVDKI